MLLTLFIISIWIAAVVYVLYVPFTMRGGHNEPARKLTISTLAMICNIMIGLLVLKIFLLSSNDDHFDWQQLIGLSTSVVLVIVYAYYFDRVSNSSKS